MNVFLGPIEPALWAIDFEKGELNSTVRQRMFKTTNLKKMFMIKLEDVPCKADLFKKYHQSCLIMQKWEGFSLIHI